MTAAITTPVGINDGCIDADPLFVNPNSDLHAQAIETNAVTGFAPQAWVTLDMDCQLRSSLTPSDLGADAYNVVFCAGTPDASNTLASVTNTCQGVGFNLSLPTVNAGADVVVCQGDSVTLNATGAASYTWNNGVANASGFIPTTTTTYTVTGTGTNGCTNTDAVVVTVNALPNVNAGNDMTVCMNSQTVLSATGAVSYVWDNGITNNTLFFVTDTMTYTVTGTDANDCVNTDAVTVTPTALPLVNAGGSIAQCGDQNVTLNATGAVSYVWNNGVANGASFTAPMGTSVYIVTVMDAQGKIILTLPNASNGSMIDLNATERGVYLIHLTAEQASKVVRVVKN
jgi:hypothetical protein